MFWTESGRFSKAWDLWREVDRMNQLFSGAGFPGTVVQEFPAVNAWSDGNEAVVTTELPGVDPAAVDISVVGRTLTLRGTRTPEEAGDGGSYHRRERWYGDFIRTIELPFSVESARVEAAFSKGVLTITLPRAEAEKPRKIAVKAA
jgi:HSP20 family protein